MSVRRHAELLAETIAMIETELGHIPKRAVTVQGLISRAAPTGRPSFTPGPLTKLAAADAVGPGSQQRAGRIGRIMEDEGCDVVVIACYSMPRREALAASMSIPGECRAQAAWIAVDESGFAELSGSPAIWPRSLIEQTHVATLRTQLGRMVVPEQELEPIPRLSQAEIADIAAQRSWLDEHPTPGVSSIGWAVQVFETVLAGKREPDDPPATAAGHDKLDTILGRNALLVASLPGGSRFAHQMGEGVEQPEVLERLYSSTIMGISRAPDFEQMERGLALMARAGSAASGEVAARAYAVNAFTCFAAGDWARAEAWIDHAEATGTGESLAAKLRTSLRVGLGPAPAWHQNAAPDRRRRERSEPRPRLIPALPSHRRPWDEPWGHGVSYLPRDTVQPIRRQRHGPICPYPAGRRGTAAR